MFSPFFVQVPKRRRLASSTLSKSYYRPIRRLPQDAPLSVELLESFVLENSSPDTRTRKRLCQAYQTLARFAGLDCDFKDIQGRYSASTVSERELPSDAVIVKAILAIACPRWRTIAGRMAVYGLRNHESFLLDLEQFQSSSIAYVTDGKTGARFVYPLYPEWVELFNVKSNDLPRVRNLEHQSLGRAVSRELRIKGVPFLPYDLRHCWARRAYEFGLDESKRAKMMGHSESVHRATYQRWIKPDAHERLWQILMRDPLCPTPPSF